MTLKSTSSPQPVAASAYQALANLNHRFEELTGDIQSLQQFNFFPSEDVTAWLNAIGRMRAEVSQRLIESLDEREMINTAYYGRLCRMRERELRDPDDVYMEAEHRKQQLAEEEQRRQRESSEAGT